MVVDSKTLAAIRSEVCNTTLRWMLIPGSIGVIFSLLRGFETGWRPVMAFHVALLGVIAALAWLGDRVPYHLRASVFVGGIFILGLGGNLTFGPPTGSAFFVSVSIMAGIFFGERVGIAIMVAGIMTTAAQYLAVQSGLLQLRDLSDYHNARSTFMLTGSALVIAALGPLIALSRFKRHLEFQRLRAEEASQSKSQFLAMMSHELRTPMAGILGIADLLLEDDLPADQEERVARIARSGKVLLDILNDLLDYSKIEARGLTLENIPFELASIVDEVYELLQPLAVERGLELRLELQPPMVTALVGDPVRLRQIIINLVGNAIKFTQKGWVRVALSQTKNSDGRLRLDVEVSDTGIGISPEERGKLFLPFSQGDSATSRRYGGTGLGLAISKRLVEMMGGAISFAPRKGGGSEFKFHILMAEGMVSPGTVGPASMRAGRQAVRKLDILVADDNETLRYLLEMTLVRWGHEVTTVEDGSQAVEAVQSGAFDVAIMDMHMPVLDGLEATRRIRALDGAVSRIPIIALTADIVEEHRKKYLTSGIDAVVGKPVNWLELAAELEKQCAAGSKSAEILSNGHGGAPTAETMHATEAEPPPAILDPVALSAISEDLGADGLKVLLRAFTKNLRRYGEEIAAAAAQRDAGRVKEIAHALKGLCMQFGAVRLAATAKVLEETSDATGVANLKKEITLLLDALAADPAYGVDAGSMMP